MVAGIVVAVVGLLLAVGGAVAGAVEQTRSSADPIAEARTPGSLEFDAAAETYLVSISVDNAADVDSVSNTRCSIRRADGTSVDLDGGIQAIGETTGKVAKVGSFTAVPGATTVSCESARDGVRFFVDDESALHRYGTVAAIVGMVTLLAGAGLILLGVFTRKRPAAA